MSLHKKLVSFLVIVAASQIIFLSVSQAQTVGLGTPISESQLQQFDMIAGADGIGLPAGSGTALQGKDVYEAKCAACHALNGEGTSGNTVLVGGDMHSEGVPLRTVGSYWPYASTLFDYVRRAMPTTAPKSLSDIEVYQVTAYVLYLNGIIDQYKILNAESLTEINMPNKDGFIDSSQQQ